MSAYLMIEVACDRYGCTETAPAKLLLTFKGDNKKMRGEVKLPAGWIEVIDHYSTYKETEHVCETHGRQSHGWRYDK